MKKSLLLLSLISVLSISACSSDEPAKSESTSESKPTSHSDIGNQPKAMIDKANNAVDKANADTSEKMEQANQ